MSVEEVQDIVQAFDELYQTERPTFAAKDEERWHFAEKIAKRKEYWDSFSGINNIVSWFTGALKHDRCGYIPRHIEHPLVERSRRFDLRVLPEIWKHLSVEQYDHYAGRWNAGDYYFANAYVVPERFHPKRVLDFGAGFGRQVNIWSQEVPNLVYTAVDVIRQSYLSQSLYFRRSGLPLKEYVVAGEDFAVRDVPGIYHVPSWRWDLVPSDFYDMVLAIFVLPEVSIPALSKALAEFKRVLRPGGALFIRDHGRLIASFNGIDVADELRTAGFILEYRPYVRGQISTDDKSADIRGVPRIWRKPHPDFTVAD